MLTGRMLDRRYHVRSRIAHGGMATVYLATDTRLDREVALKVMHADLARDAEFVARFIGEAKSVAQLSHQNIVAVFDQGGRRRVPLPGHGVRARADAAGADARARLVHLAGGAGDHGPHPGRAGGRAPGRDRAPGRQAGERADHPGRAGQGGGLRARPGLGRRRQHAGRADHRLGRLHRARAGHRGGHRRQDRRLLGRRPAVRDAHRAAAVHRGDPPRGGLRARQLRRSRGRLGRRRGHPGRGPAGRRGD